MVLNLRSWHNAADVDSLMQTRRPIKSGVLVTLPEGFTNRNVAFSGRDHWATCGWTWICSPDGLFTLTLAAQRGHHSCITYARLADALLSKHTQTDPTVFFLYRSNVRVVCIEVVQSRVTVTHEWSWAIERNAESALKQSCLHAP